MNPNSNFFRGTFHILDSDHVRDVRLPRHVEPDVYQLELIPIIEEGNFTILGKLSFQFAFNEDMTQNDTSLASKIYFHAKEIQVLEETVDVYDDNGVYLRFFQLLNYWDKFVKYLDSKGHYFLSKGLWIFEKR